MPILVVIKVIVITIPAISTVASITWWSSSSYNAFKESRQESWWLTLLLNVVLCRIRKSLPHFTIWHKLCRGALKFLVFTLRHCNNSRNSCLLRHDEIIVLWTLETSHLFCMLPYGDKIVCVNWWTDDLGRQYTALYSWVLAAGSTRYLVAKRLLYVIYLEKLTSISVWRMTKSLWGCYHLCIKNQLL